MCDDDIDNDDEPLVDADAEMTDDVSLSLSQLILSSSSASQDQRPTPHMHDESEVEDAAVALRTRSKFRDVKSAEERQTSSSEPPVQVEHHNSIPRELHMDDIPVTRSNGAKPVQDGFSFTSFQVRDLKS